jgi:hypothetical protein
MERFPTAKDVGEKIWKAIQDKKLEKVVMPVKEIDMAERVLGNS